tara:strand:+ start:960 stop:2018 length:1059 start_codon:yes stop_codon:yes gene_type:complete
MKHTIYPLNIIYLNTTEKGPSGGGKTIYYHSNLINNLKISNVSSEVLHIKKKKTSKWSTSVKKIFNASQEKYSGWNLKDVTVSKNFKSKWFKEGIKLKENFIFDKKKDFVIFPEIYAHFAKKLCISNNIPYAIFVQNGYCLNSTSDFKTLAAVYKNAKFILSYSKDISKCISLAFHNSEKKIFKTNISVDINKFKFSNKKNNIITYMPRKLPVHSNNLLFFLRNRLPKNWKFKSLHNLNEKDVYKYLLKSKIFLSFSNMEGLGIPPIEAAIAGNKVIGYTGRGGTEYWKKPIFTEIPHGNISKFINEILKNIKEKNLLKKLSVSRKKITNNFSPSQEKKQIIKMINKIKSIR